jgi:magnesium chelatase subunit H
LHDPRFVFLTMAGSQNAALLEAARMLEQKHGIRLHLSLHSLSNLRSDGDWHLLQQDITRADFIFGGMIFGEEFVRPIEQMLDQVSAPICMITSNPNLIYCTRLGKLVLRQHEEKSEPGPLKQWMQRLRPRKNGKEESHRQTALSKNLTKFMKFVPGKMRDLHSFIAAHNFWMHSSPENLERMLCLFLERYVPGFEGRVPVQEPIEYPDSALYHPDAPAPFPDLESYQRWRKQQGMPVATRSGDSSAWQGAVGLMTMRAFVLSRNNTHLDALIRSLEAQGLEARAAYSSMLDFRPAIDQYFSGKPSGKTTLRGVDLLINCTGFPLVGGPAGSRPDEASEALAGLDVGYHNLIPLGFQRVEDWRADNIGLNPMQSAMNIALPELDGISEPVIYGGPTATSEKFIALDAEIDIAVRRTVKRVKLRGKANRDKKLTVVLFNFPPNLGNAGTAAFLDVFASLHRLLSELRDAGYTVDVPATPEALRHQVVDGNSALYGTDGNLGARLPVDEYRRRFPWYTEIEPNWGYAPGELLNDGKDFYILGAYFGNVFVAMQPSFGYERDPMRLLMGKDATPHHGFAAFYTWIDQVYNADAVVHFGTHGALEFMPGKQVGVGADCWPTRLLGSLPNYYYYCVNNPSEASIAKRRGSATLVSYMVPPLQQAGLYKGLRRLKDNLESYQKHPDPELLTDIRTQASQLGIEVTAAPAASPNGHANGHSNGNGKANGKTNGHTNGNGHTNASSAHVEGASIAMMVNGNGANGHQSSAALSDQEYIAALGHELIQVEHRLIPLGLHVLGKAPSDAELVDILALVAAFNPVMHPNGKEKLPTLPQLIAGGLGWDYQAIQETLKTGPCSQDRWEQIEHIMHQAMARFVAAPRSPRLDVKAVETYLQQNAKLPPGLLVNLWTWLEDLKERILHDQEVRGLLHSLEGGYITPSPGNDVVRNQLIVPTGRNIHALDPYRIPTPVSMAAAAKLVENILERLTAEQGKLPETIAMVLWGTDNLKSDGEGIAQCLHLLGVRPVEDELGNVVDVALVPLEELGRPRIDVVMTVSGIFRDLFHNQAGLLDKAVRLTAAADEPLEWNFVRKHTLATAAELGVSFDEAVLRVYSNAPGSYGANVNHLIESSTWEDENQLSEAFLTRKSFAYRPGGQWQDARAVMESSLATVDATFQNIDSFEMGITDVDHYYEYLGGVTKSVEKIRGKRPPVLVADAIARGDRVSSLEQMVRLESRAKLLNPKWYDAMLEHGYEGVREIETRVSNTYGWSATADAVGDWVYDDIAETFLLDDEMRAKMAKANPHATAAIARRLLEAESRGFWDANDEMIDRLREIYGNLEDQVEGVYTVAAGAAD